MSIVAKLRKLLEKEHNQEYPPSEDLWKTILQITLKPKEENLDQQLKILRARAKHEEDLYKPNLPEPLVTAFYHQRKLYYLDSHMQVYQTDPGNPLVGNLVGKLQPNPENPKKLDFILNTDKSNHQDGDTQDNQSEFTITTTKVKKKTMHNKVYYTDLEHKIYRGLHPNLNLIYHVGELTEEGRIKLN